MARTKFTINTSNTYRVDVGIPPEKKIEGWITTNVYFHGFVNLSTIRDECVESPDFFCLCRKWTLSIWPGGEEDSLEGFVGVQLENRSHKSIEIQYSFSVRDANGKEVVQIEPNIDEFAAIDTDDQGNACGKCFTAFAKRSTIMKLLVQGSLIVEIRMKLPCTGSSAATHFVPTNQFNQNMLELFMDEETADVVFEVGEEQQTKGRRKKAKSTTNFHAHRLILKNNASELYDMCGAVSRGGGITTVSITDVTPEIFEFMLYYAYGGKLSDEDLEANAKHIINACDKYGVVNLKLEAEACYVNTTTITINNMIDILLYADSKNLALLKEAVMDYIIENKHSIIGKVSFSDVPSDMMTDLLTAMARGHPNESGNGDEDMEESIKYNTMRVGTLRKMLDEKGLDVDGSREAMIALLKEHDAIMNS